MRLNTKTGQNAIEYLLLLALVVGIVLVFLRVELPGVVDSANVYFNRASTAIVGDPPICGDGGCDQYETETGCCDCFSDCDPNTP